MSALGHVAIGFVAARRVTPAAASSRVLGLRMAALAALAILPDIDFLTSAVAPSMHALAHRGATHSLVFAGLVGTIVAIGAMATHRRDWVRLALIATAVVASHGLLDAFGRTSLGVELLWPFSDARFVAPWHVFPNPSPAVAPTRFAVQLAVEALYFAPAWAYAFVPRRARRGRRVDGSAGGDTHGG